MAEGRTNSAIAGALHVSVGSAEKHIASISPSSTFAPDDSENRRVLAGPAATSNPEPHERVSDDFRQ